MTEVHAVESPVEMVQRLEGLWPYQRMPVAMALAMELEKAQAEIRRLTAKPTGIPIPVFYGWPKEENS